MVKEPENVGTGLGSSAGRSLPAGRHQAAAASLPAPLLPPPAPHSLPALSSHPTPPPFSSCPTLPPLPSCLRLPPPLGPHSLLPHTSSSSPLPHSPAPSSCPTPPHCPFPPAPHLLLFSPAPSSCPTALPLPSCPTPPPLLSCPFLLPHSPALPLPPAPHPLPAPSLLPHTSSSSLPPPPSPPHLSSPAAPHLAASGRRAGPYRKHRSLSAGSDLAGRPSALPVAHAGAVAALGSPGAGRWRGGGGEAEKEGATIERWRTEGAPQRAAPGTGAPADAGVLRHPGMNPDGAYKQLDPLEDRGAQPTRFLLKCSRSALLSTILLALFILIFFLFNLRLNSVLRSDARSDAGGDARSCGDTCRIVLVESIPEGMTFSDGSVPNPSTFSTWMNLLGTVTHSLDIASFYWTMTNEDTRTHEPSAAQGEQILEELLQLSQRGVTVRIAVSHPSARSPLNDLQALEQSGAVVRTVDMPRLTGGVLHTKFWLVDGTHLYIGSANMDWRSLTQVKELGAAVYNCSCLAKDLGKIFEAYWALGVPGASIPVPWPANYSTTFNMETPLELKLNDTDAAIYFSSSPPALCATGRTQDLGALLSVIDAAEDFVDIAVMSYLPTTEFSHPQRFWPAIDNRLRKAVFERRVKVRLLAGCWRHSQVTMFPFLKSLAAVADNRTRYSVEVRLFMVPASAAQAQIPYARVNHNKYMVTEKVAYIGTSNWSGDYFVRTAGSALVVNQTVSAAGTSTIRDQLQAVFERDWSSQYSADISNAERWETVCGSR